MAVKTKHNLIDFFIAAIWFANGLYCKVLNYVPRHEEIVARVLGDGRARTITIFIGVAEVVMAIWILSRVWPRFNAMTQIVVVATMNVLEFLFAPDLLLWGRMNAVFAIMFIIVVYYNEFRLHSGT